MKINKSLSLKPRIYDYNVKINLSINPETIPVLIPDKRLKAIQKINTPQGKIQDPDPFYVTEEIEDITQPANGVTFTPEFWETYLAVLSDRPIPGRKKGHLSPYSYGNAENDFYTIGGKLEGNKVFLKIYVPPFGFETSNEGFIRDNEAGLIHFSIVSWTEDEITRDEYGDIKSIKAIRSVKGERNDAVEVGLGAMDQKVNNADLTHENTKEEFTMGDNVYKDIIKNICNQLENGTVSELQIANDLKIEVATDEHKEAIKILGEIKTLLGNNPVEAIKAMKEKENTVNQQVYNDMREKAMTKEFGPMKINVDGQEKDNLKRVAAEPHVSKSIITEEEMNAMIEKAKKDPLVKQLSFQDADVNSDVNKITGVKIEKDNSDVRKSEVIKI